MKKLFFLFFASTILLSGCLETTEEITLNADGSGTVNTKSDLSTLIGLAKQMGGGGEELDKLSEKPVDTTVSLATLVDSIESLTAEEKVLLRQGTMHLNLNMKDEKFFASIQFPFTDPSSIDAYTRLTNKILGAAMKEKMEESPMGAMGQSPDITSINDYYELHFENGQLKKSLNKKKYADLDNDEYLKGLKDAAGKGLPVTSTHIINLPSPATKVEGKNVSLSDDKRKVTVKVSIEDLFDDPEKLEFKIKY